MIIRNPYAAEYQRLFDSMIINPSRVLAINSAVNLISGGRARYQELEAQTKVPWFFIGVMHYMEATCNFSRHLHNGDPLTARTVQVPKGRPATGTPPFTFEQSAIDALQLKKLHTVTNWNLPNMLYLLESYNGWGYRNLRQPINSPYLWSFSNHYTKGKYVADGKYDPNAISKQAGAAVIMKAVMIRHKLLNAAGGFGLLIAAVATFFF